MFLSCIMDFSSIVIMIEHETRNEKYLITINTKTKGFIDYKLGRRTLGIHIKFINNWYKMISIRMQVFSRISNKGVRKMLYFKFFFKIKLSKFLLVHFMERWTIFVHIRTHFTYKIGTVTPFLHVDIGMALLRIIWRFRFHL